jgi:hypothetical protein
MASAVLQKPNENVVGTFLIEISGESCSPPESYAMMLASEKRTQRKSSWVDRGPRKVLSWECNPLWSEPRGQLLLEVQASGVRSCNSSRASMTESRLMV